MFCSKHVDVKRHSVCFTEIEKNICRIFFGFEFIRFSNRGVLSAAPCICQKLNFHCSRSRQRHNCSNITIENIIYFLYNNYNFILTVNTSHNPQVVTPLSFTSRNGIHSLHMPRCNQPKPRATGDSVGYVFLSDFLKACGR